jgi:hypothetical protein
MQSAETSTFVGIRLRKHDFLALNRIKETVKQKNTSRAMRLALHAFASLPEKEQIALAERYGVAVE